MEGIIHRTIARYNLLDAGDRVLIALSGGPDSMCMLDILYKLKDDYKIELAIAHVNHKIRVESDIEEDFVRDVAYRYNLSIYVKRLDIDWGDSDIENRARNERYAFLYSIANRYDYNKIAVAHNIDDLFETIMFNLFRGSGLKGIRGFPISHDGIIRPIAFVSRDRIMSYLKENRISYVIDRSNYETKQTRNKIRHKLAPVVREIFPSYTRSIGRFKQNIDVHYNWFYNYIRTITNDAIYKLENEVVVLKVGVLQSYDKYIQREVVRYVVESILGIYDTFTQDRLNIINIEGSNKTLLQTKRVVITLDYDFVFIRNRQYSFEIGDGISLNYFEKISLKNLKIALNLVNFTHNKGLIISNRVVRMYFCTDDIDKVVLRAKRSGDAISIRNGHKSLKKLFIDNKLPRFERDRVVVVDSTKGIVGCVNPFWGWGRVGYDFYINKGSDKIGELIFEVVQ